MSTTNDSDFLEYEGGNLYGGTNWWGAFVIGLAGTILVTGAAPAFLTVFGASYIPFIIFFTLTTIIIITIQEGNDIRILLNRP